MRKFKKNSAPPPPDHDNALNYVTVSFITTLFD